MSKAFANTNVAKHETLILDAPSINDRLVFSRQALTSTGLRAFVLAVAPVVIVAAIAALAH